MRAILARSGVTIERLGAILDFGCGAGRVLRHWKSLEGPALHGTDYNPELVAWCAASLPFAHVPRQPAGRGGRLPGRLLRSDLRILGIYSPRPRGAVVLDRRADAGAQAGGLSLHHDARRTLPASALAPRTRSNSVAASSWFLARSGRGATIVRPSTPRATSGKRSPRASRSSTSSPRERSGTPNRTHTC